MVGAPMWTLPGIEASWCAVRIGDGAGIGEHADRAVAPASVVKIPIALTVAAAVESGALDGTARVHLGPHERTPGPVGVSLMADDVEVSVRDLLVLMLTISDNVATDALLGLVGVDAVNATTRRIAPAMHLVSDLRTMLDAAAVEAGFADYDALARHDPAVDGAPTADDVRDRLATSAVLDPRRGTRTTAAATAALLTAIWTDRAGPPAACRRVRTLMGRQLTRQRIGAGFPSDVAVAAKSGGLFGVVHNEAGVVTLGSGEQFAVAVFTRCPPRGAPDGRDVDAAIGRLAHDAVEHLRS